MQNDLINILKSIIFLYKEYKKKLVITSLISLIVIPIGIVIKPFDIFEHEEFSLQITILTPDMRIKRITSFLESSLGEFKEIKKIKLDKKGNNSNPILNIILDKLPDSLQVKKLQDEVVFILKSHPFYVNKYQKELAILEIEQEALEEYLVDLQKKFDNSKVNNGIQDQIPNTILKTLERITFLKSEIIKRSYMVIDNPVVKQIDINSLYLIHAIYLVLVWFFVSVFLFFVWAYALNLKKELQNEIKK